MMQIEPPYLLFLGDVEHIGYAKTAAGINQWRGEHVKGQYRLKGCDVTLGMPDMTPAEAAKAGVKTMMIGTANKGGFIAESWQTAIIAALEAGLDVAAGLHQKLISVPAIVEAAERNGCKLFDVRQSSQAFEVGFGHNRTGKRVLTVGTDCAVGKKYTALATEKSMHEAGMKATYRATGQTGIFIAGRGVAVDSVVADFISGAAEWLSPDNEPDHWDVIEGQGSLFHPAYAGVSLGLLHGSQPDALIICHEAHRNELAGVPGYKTPSLSECIETNLRMARLTNPKVKAAGISVNTSGLSEEDAQKFLKAAEEETALPATDPIRYGMEKIVAHIKENFE
jgi:uncharacterized NAD-dependent epimerase/dehydratase family protein